MVQSVERALDILDALGDVEDESQGIGVLELSRKLELNSSTVHALLKTLAQREYVSQAADSRKYLLGRGPYNLVRERLITRRLAKAAKPVVLDLMRELNESVVLNLYRKGEGFVVLRTECDHIIKVDKSVLDTENFYGRTTGRILLSRLTLEEQRDYAKRHGFPGEIWDGISDFDALRAALHEIRAAKSSVYITRGGVCGIAIPVLAEDNDEPLNTALGVYLPSTRFKGKHRKRVIESIQKAAKRIALRFSC